MQWYFVDNGQPNGPHSFEELQKFHRERRIQDTTPCWREGLPEWKPFLSLLAEYAPHSAPSSFPAHTPFPVEAPRRPSAASTPSSLEAPSLSSFGQMEAPRAGSANFSTEPDPNVLVHTCVQCRAVFSQEDMLHFQNYWVCAACKPVFLEAISEGVVSRGRLTYASGVSRLGAYLVDSFLVSIVATPITLLIQGVDIFNNLKGDHMQQPNPIYQLLAFLFGVLFLSFYYFISVALIQSTPGLLFFGIRLVKPDGTKISFLEGLFWTLASIVCVYTCNILAITTYFDPEKRALQEFMVNTRLVYKRI